MNSRANRRCTTALYCTTAPVLYGNVLQCNVLLPCTSVYCPTARILRITVIDTSTTGYCTTIYCNTAHVLQYTVILPQLYSILYYCPCSAFLQHCQSVRGPAECLTTLPSKGPLIHYSTLHFIIMFLGALDYTTLHWTILNCTLLY